MQGLLRLFTGDLQHTDADAAEVEKRLLANQLMNLAVKSTEVRMRAQLFSQGATHLAREGLDALGGLKTTIKSPVHLVAAAASALASASASATAAAAAAGSITAAMSASPMRIESLLKLTNEVYEQLLGREQFGTTSALTVLPMCVELALEHAHQVNAPNGAPQFAVATPTARVFFESFRQFAGLDFYRLFIPSNVISPSSQDLVRARACGACGVA